MSKPEIIGKILCFHHSGGEGSFFHIFSPFFSYYGFEIIPINLPGRLDKHQESYYTEFPALIERLSVEITEHCHLPTILFGHSLGGLIAFECAKFFAHQDCLTLLVTSSCASPSAQSSREINVNATSNEELLSLLKKHDILPEKVTIQDNTLLSRLCADFRLFANYKYHPTKSPLSIPILALGGTTDAIVSPKLLQGWEEETSAGYTQKLFPGGHFYLKDHPKKVAEFIIDNCFNGE